MSHYLEPDDPEAALARAGDLCDLNRFAEAERIVRRALTRRPEHLGLLTQLASVLDSRYRNEECLEVTEAALRLWPQAPALYYYRGRALEYLGRNAEAVATLAEGVRLDPYDAGMLRDYGEYLAYAGRHREAIDVLERALAVHPGDADLLCRLAHCHNRVGDNHKAHELLTAALERDPHDAITWYALADNHWALSRARPSLAAYAECVRLEPDHATAVPMVRYNMVWPISTAYTSLRWSLPAVSILAVTGMLALPRQHWTAWAAAGLAVAVTGYAAHWLLRGGGAAWRAVGRTFPAVKLILGAGLSLGAAGCGLLLAGLATGKPLLAGAGLAAAAALWIVMGVDSAVEPDPHMDQPVLRRALRGIATMVHRDFTVIPKTLYRRLKRAIRTASARPTGEDAARTENS